MFFQTASVQIRLLFLLRTKPSCYRGTMEDLVLTLSSEPGTESDSMVKMVKKTQFLLKKLMAKRGKLILRDIKTWSGECSDWDNLRESAEEPMAKPHSWSPGPGLLNQEGTNLD
ncbi:uncharacterized protein RBU33_017031 isoform 1-T2 [Hipposideros larvatus]